MTHEQWFGYIHNPPEPTIAAHTLLIRLAFAIGSHYHTITTTTTTRPNEPLERKFFLQTLQMGANEASAQVLQNGLKNEAHRKFTTNISTVEVRVEVCMRTV